MALVHIASELYFVWNSGGLEEKKLEVPNLRIKWS